MTKQPVKVGRRKKTAKMEMPVKTAETIADELEQYAEKLLQTAKTLRGEKG